MNRKHLAVVGVVIAAAVTGCGPRQSAHNDAVNAVAAQPPAQAVDVVEKPTLTPYVVTESLGRDATPNTLSIEDLQGSVIAQTALPDGDVTAWSESAVNGAAFFVASGELKRLDLNGKVTDLAAMPSNITGHVAISNDGTKWMYTTSTQSGTTVTNAIYTGGVDQPARMINTQTVTDGGWDWVLYNWTSTGVFAQHESLEGCGCGAYDMQTDAKDSYLIDPTNGTVNPLVATPTCAVSSVSSQGIGACFTVDPNTGGATGIEFFNAQSIIARYDLSGTNLAGDVRFSNDGKTATYATVPLSVSPGCGSDWQPHQTLHVMNVANGNAHVAGGAGLDPNAFLDNGNILAQQSTATSGGDSTRLVEVDPTSGAMTVVQSSAPDLVVGATSVSTQPAGEVQ